MDAVMSNPAISAAPIIPNQKPSVIYGFDKMKVILTLYSNQNYVSYRQVLRIARLNSDQIAIVHLALH